MVDRSRRRVTVVGWTITVGVTCAGLLGAAPAAADDEDAGAATSARGSESPAVSPRAERRAASGSTRPAAASGIRPGAPAAVSSRPVRITAAGDRSEPSHGSHPHGPHWPKPHWPKPHWPKPPCVIPWSPHQLPVPIRPEVEGGQGAGLLLVAPIGFPQVSAVGPAVFSSSAVRVLNGVDAPADAAAGGPVTADAAAGGPASAPDAPPPAPGAPAANPGRASMMPAASGPPDRTPAVPLQQPKPAAPQPDTVRLGYPEPLRYADLPEVAAAALPGLAAILAFTAAGGFLGYRQARAGSALRAAGTARFLR